MESATETQCIKNGKSEGFRSVSRMRRRRRCKVSVIQNVSFVAYRDDDVDDDDGNPSLILHECLFCGPLPNVCYSRLRGNKMRPFMYTAVLKESATVFCSCVSLSVENCTTAVCCEDVGTIFH